MAGEREKLTRTDVAEAVRAMASFPWQEMLDVQRETAQALRGIRFWGLVLSLLLLLSAADEIHRLAALWPG